MDEMVPFVPWVRLVKEFPTQLLIEELERRAKEQLGSFTGEQSRKIQELNAILNPEPLRGT